jgi:hypothetical protein
MGHGIGTPQGVVVSRVESLQEIIGGSIGHAFGRRDMCSIGADSGDPQKKFGVKHLLVNTLWKYPKKYPI